MSAKTGLVSIVRECKKHLLYKVAGCLLLRGCLSIEVNGRTVRISEVSVIQQMSTIERGFTVLAVGIPDQCLHAS